MERDYRPLIVAVALSAAMLFAGWRLGVIGEPAPVYIPTFFDQIRPGMTVDELKALGGLPHDPDAPSGPPHFEFRGDVDRGKGVIYGDPFIADTQFVRGQLVRFELRTSDSYAGAPIDHGDLLALVPVLAEAKMLRQGYSAEALVDALGEGVRVARIVDTTHGAIDVLRWDVALDGRRVARLEASVASGQVIAHQLTE